MAVCSSVVSPRMLQLMTEILSGKLSHVIECSSRKLTKLKKKNILFVVTVICTKIYEGLTYYLNTTVTLVVFFNWEGILHHKFVYECTMFDKENT